MHRFLSVLSIFLFAALPAWAVPQPWQIDFQNSASSIMDKIVDFHHLLLVIITAIVVIVLGLLIWIIARYNHHVNPTPATFTHNKFWERMWTIIPVLILLVIAVPSFRLMYYQGTIPKPDLTIKATGYQWYWGYEYPDQEISFQSNMIPEKEIDKSKGQVRLLSVDNILVVPVNKNIQILTTASDVLHAWTIPSFGVKKDAVPGRINETWFRATKTGVFYGQCSEICGTGHAYMPIELHVVTQEAFDAWVLEAKTKFGSVNDNNQQLAAAE